MTAGSQSSEFWVGVDISKASFDVAVAMTDAATSDWAKLPAAQFAMSKKGVAEFAQWLEKYCASATCVGVCIESTGVYSHLFAQLVEPLGLPEIAMVNPALPYNFRKSLALRDKCDRVDAAVIALFGVVHRPVSTWSKTPEYRGLRNLWRLYEDYAEDVMRWNNRIEQCLDEGIKKQIKRTRDMLKKKCDKVWEDIEKYVEAHAALRDDAKFMCSIPGVGMKSAVILLAECGDLRTWSRKQLISYAGLYPKVYSSGTSVNRKPTLARGGGRRIRQALFLPACSAVQCNKPLARWRQQLLDRGKSKKASVLAVERKLLNLIRAVVVSEHPYDPDRLQAKTT